MSKIILNDCRLSCATHCAGKASDSFKYSLNCQEDTSDYACEIVDNSGHQKKMTGNECNKKKNTFAGISATERQRVLGCSSAMGKHFALIIPGKQIWREEVRPCFPLENHIWSRSMDAMKAC